jgi:hypothetical protein
MTAYGIKRGVASPANVVKLKLRKRSDRPAPIPNRRLQSGISRIFGPFGQLTSDSVGCASASIIAGPLSICD